MFFPGQNLDHVLDYGKTHLPKDTPVRNTLILHHCPDVFDDGLPLHPRIPIQWATPSQCALLGPGRAYGFGLRHLLLLTTLFRGVGLRHLRCCHKQTTVFGFLGFSVQKEIRIFLRDTSSENGRREDELNVARTEAVVTTAHEKRRGYFFMANNTVLEMREDADS